jgi:signal transduction histidine kinase
MARRESALSVDAPVTLDELLDKNARDTLQNGADDLGFGLAVVDRDAEWLIGKAIGAPDETLTIPLDIDPVLITVDGKRWVAGPLYHEGAEIGRVVLGPFDDQTPPELAIRYAAHLCRVTDAFLVDGIKRAMSARMHMATLEEANRELTEKNRRLAQAVERLQEADRVKSNFLATVSHELRTPLTSVIGYSEMLLEGIAGDLNDEQREYVRTVMEKGDQLLQLITGILDISRMEANEMRFEKSPFDLKPIIDVALSTIAPQARRKTLKITSELPALIPQVLGDRDKVRQVLLNLLNNAVKFTPESGAVNLHIELGTIGPNDEPGVGGEPTAVRISVHDSGIGITPEHQKRIFDPFYQVDSSSTREFGGTGLGLSIVKRFVEAHHGQVWVESSEGQGATFTFTLPLAPAP